MLNVNNNDIDYHLTPYNYRKNFTPSNLATQLWKSLFGPSYNIINLLKIAEVFYRILIPLYKLHCVMYMFSSLERL